VKSDSRLHLVVPATLQDARAASDRIMGLCDRMDVENRARFGTAVMEWLVNVVKHSYAHAAEGRIEIVAAVGPDSIELVVEDTGQGMPPWRFDTAAAEIEFDPKDLDNLPESGMGLAIIKSVMDSVRYQSDQGINRLIAVRRWQR
jgi:serine/threonine-protein kinase RsbW